jgi:hypothetical protein
MKLSPGKVDELFNRGNGRSGLQRRRRPRYSGENGYAGEDGYAMVGLIGVMLFSLILTTAAAPKVLFETKREKEEEMLWRGQQVAAALSLYTNARNGQYPTELSALVEGIDLGTRRVRFLRPSALCDPMMPCESGNDTNWRLVHPGDPLVRELLEAYLAAQMKPGSNLPPPPQSLLMFAQMSGRQGFGNSADGGNESMASSFASAGMQGMGPSSSQGGLSGGFGQSGGLAGGGDGSSSGSSLGFSGEGNQPIIGIVSRKSDRMFRTYFGIEYYDHSLFFPAIPIVAGGFVSPQTLFAIEGSAGKAPQCDGGGVLINGRCYGRLTPGALCRGADGASVPCQK